MSFVLMLLYCSRLNQLSSTSIQLLSASIQLLSEITEMKARRQRTFVETENLRGDGKTSF